MLWPAFKVVKDAIECLFVDKTTSLDALKKLIQKDRDIHESLKDVCNILKEANDGEYSQLKRYFYSDIIKCVLPDNLFFNKWDRGIVNCRNATQKQMITFVQIKAAQAPRTATEETIVAYCIDAVSRKWQTKLVDCQPVLHLISNLGWHRSYSSNGPYHRSSRSVCHGRRGYREWFLRTENRYVAPAASERYGLDLSLSTRRTFHLVASCHCEVTNKRKFLITKHL